MAIPFSLKPFEPISDLVISGRVVRSQSSITVEYTLTGAVDDIKVPSAVGETPSRRDHLWENTCFEIFIGLPNSPQYWEVNAWAGQAIKLGHLSHHTHPLLVSWLYPLLC